MRSDQAFTPPKNQTSQNSSESWDVRSNSPPPKSAHPQSTKNHCGREWPNRASDFRNKVLVTNLSCLVTQVRLLPAAKPDFAW
jgi:hypothetical protein